MTPCDVGFWVRGRTGLVRFIFESETRNDDGSIRDWTFNSGKFTVTIIND
jgi:hypothetical protein